MAAHQPDPDPNPLPLPLPLLIVGDTGLDADLLAGLGATPIRIDQAGRPLDPLDPGSLPGVSAPAAGA